MEARMAASVQRVAADVGGRPIVFETGSLARQANGSVTVRGGDTMVLVTATSAQPREGIDFFPLTCDFEERMSAACGTPGRVMKGEGPPAQGGVQACRLVDRPIRPLFSRGFRNDVQVIATVLFIGDENDPAIARITGSFS